jgi:ATP-dependent Clp protease ATP-binding subunit ClpA
MVPLDLESRAAREAQDLGHRRIGPEHLLLALLDTGSAGREVLGTCGLSRESVMGEISRLPEGYHRMIPRGGTPTGPMLVYDPDIRSIRARAEGLAAGMGSTRVLDEHVLLALLWEPGPPLAVRLIQRLGVTREQVLAELRRRGVETPELPLPYLPSWGPPFYVSHDEFERLAADLRRRGVLYRANSEGERMMVSVDESDEKRGPRPSDDE